MKQYCLVIDFEWVKEGWNSTAWLSTLSESKKDETVLLGYRQDTVAERTLQFARHIIRKVPCSPAMRLTLDTSWLYKMKRITEEEDMEINLARWPTQQRDLMGRIQDTCNWLCDVAKPVAHCLTRDQSKVLNKYVSIKSEWTDIYRYLFEIKLFSEASRLFSLIDSERGKRAQWGWLMNWLMVNMEWEHSEVDWWTDWWSTSLCSLSMFTINQFINQSHCALFPRLS